ncbi:MAG TPA: TlpA disulfide reductase family protein [Dongiaceae bacterium]|jgi:thiol-disulfide isomerase/thioredoxin|nr:TlpA disulfide reductase family protein [Dongiaceae bacterium]
MTPKIRALLVFGLTLAIVFGSLAIVTYSHRSPEPVATGAVSAPATPEGRFAALPAADFTSVAPVDGKGQPADMAPYRGKALLVNLWATWCAPCIQELPSLGKLQEQLGGADFQVVTIAIDERDPSKIAPFLAAHGAGNLPVLIDLNRTIDKIAQVSALPTSLLVDRDGKAKAMFTGDARWNCGKALDAVKAFVADGTVSNEVLEACE